MTWLPTLNFLLAVGGLALAFVTFALYVDYIWFKGRYFKERVNEAAWPIAAAATVGTVFLTLLYSEYFKFIPCSLCWLQRIAIYPQALMVLMAWRSADTRRFPVYGIGLSAFGLIVALYHTVYQMLPPSVRESGVAPCLIDGTGADCASKIMNEFGFVTFPLLSAITFAFLIAVYLYMLRFSR